MAINFPSSPTPGQLYTYGDNTWEWSGDYWGVYSAQTGYVTSVTSSGSGFPVINSYSNNSLVLKSFSGTNMTITDSGGQLNFYVPLNGGSGGQLYYFNISKTQTPYLEIATSATTGSEQSITSAVTSGNTITLGQFLTPSGFPGVSIIPGGVWSFFLHSYKQNSSASFDIFCEAYKRTTGGTETYLFSSDPVPITSNSPTPSMGISDVYYSGTTLDTSDRILVNVRVTNTSSSTYSATFISEGLQHYSYFSSPLLLPTTDTYVDSFTYTPSANTITIGQTQNYPSQSITINSFSGLSVGVLSATTYQNLPTDIRVTGATKSGTVATFTNNTGGTFTLTGLTDTFVTGGTYNNGTTTFTNNTGGTFNVSGFFTGATDVFVTGGTYSDNTFTYTNNTGGTFGVLFNTVTGLTVNGNLNITGTTTSTSVSATTISANTYNNYIPLPTQASASTGVVLSFVTDTVYGTLLSPETGTTITAETTNALLGVTNILIHSGGTTPTFSSQYKKLTGSGNYSANTINYIFTTYITSTEIIYSINQRT